MYSLNHLFGSLLGFLISLSSILESRGFIDSIIFKYRFVFLICFLTLWGSSLESAVVTVCSVFIEVVFLACSLHNTNYKHPIADFLSGEFCNSSIINFFVANTALTCLSIYSYTLKWNGCYIVLLGVLWYFYVLHCLYRSYNFLRGLRVVVRMKNVPMPLFISLSPMSYLPFKIPQFLARRKIEQFNLPRLLLKCILCIHDLCTATKWSQRVSAITHFLMECDLSRLISYKRSIISSLIKLYKPHIFEPQGGEWFTSWLGLKQNPLYKSVRRCLCYLAIMLRSEDSPERSFSDSRIMRFLEFDREFKDVDTQHDSDMVEDVCALFQKMYDYGGQILSGDYKGLLHCPSSYGSFVTSYATIVSRYETEGACVVAKDLSYVQTLESVTEQCTMILEAMNPKASGYIRMRTELSILNSITNSVILEQRVVGNRDMPFGIVIYGKPGVGKSSVTELLHRLYCKQFNLDTEGTLYVRNPADPYWTNFRSSAVTIAFDDMMAVEPDKEIGNPYEFIPVINVMSYNPPQAALEDKGRHYVNAKLVIGTTNRTPEEFQLYLNYAYKHSSAVQRRWPIRVELDVEPGPTLNLAQDVSEQWRLTVSRIRMADGTRNGCVLDRIADKVTIQEFMTMMKREFDAHRALGDRMVNVGDQLSSIVANTLVGNISGDVLEISPESDTSLETLISDDSLSDDSDELLLADLGNSSSSVPFSVRSWVLSTFTNRPELFFDDLFGMCTEKSQSMFALIKDNGTMIGTLVSLLGALVLLNKASGRGNEPHAEDDESVKPVVIEPHGSDVSKILPPEPEEANVWHEKEMDVDQLPYAVSQLSTRFGDLVRLASSATMSLRVFKNDNVSNCINLLGLTGSIYVTVAHTLKHLKSPKVQVVRRTKKKRGVSSNSKIFQLDPCQMYFCDELDLVFLNLIQIPPVQDITKHFSNSFTEFVSGTVCYRDPSGDLYTHDAEGIHSSRVTYGDVERDELLYTGPDTCKGWCGAPIVAKLPRGSVIVGFHSGRAIGPMRVLSAHRLTADCINDAVGHFLKNFQFPSFAPQGAVNLISPLEVLHHKSTVRFVDRGSLHIFGTVGYSISPKSCVVSTPIRNEVASQLGPVDLYPAVMRGWKPWYIALSTSVMETDFEVAELLTASSDYMDPVIKLAGEVRGLDPLPLGLAVNGIPGVKFIDPLKFNTSAGYPVNRPKKEFVTLVTDPEVVEQFNIKHGLTEGFAFDEVKLLHDHVLSDFKKTLALANSGERTSPIFTAHLKDEPVGPSKIHPGRPKEKTRVFSGSPFVFTLLMRKYYLPLVRLIQSHPDLFECAAGVNATGPRWGHMFKRLIHFGPDFIIAGDYEKFDKNMEIIVLTMAFHVLNELVITGQSNRDPDHLEEIRKTLRSISTDVIFAFTIFKGDLIMFWGTNPSGHSLTTILNSIVNSLYLRMAFFSLKPMPLRIPFRDAVHLYTYGDDNIFGVSPIASWFNHVAIADYFATRGLVYTSDDKVSEIVPFKNISEVTFLKRSFKIGDDGWIYAPLAVSSILKSISLWIPSKSVSPQAQLIDSMDSAYRESFQHGKEYFEKFCAVILRLLDEHNLRPYIVGGKFPSYDEMEFSRIQQM